MKKLHIYISLFLGGIATAQSIDSLRLAEQDTISMYYELSDVVVSKKGYEVSDARTKLLILKRRVYKTYPYAKATADKLTELNAVMANLKTEKEKKRYFKIVEKYLIEEFEPRLKQLSRNDGKILVKLINRQTGETTFDLIKDYKSGWKAFWSNNTAKMFNINLKENYEPYNELEDFQIERLLYSAFSQGILVRQEAAKPINVNDLTEHWQAKTKKQEKTSQK